MVCIAFMIGRDTVFDRSNTDRYKSYFKGLSKNYNPIAGCTWSSTTNEQNAGEPSKSVNSTSNSHGSKMTIL